jgi:hypothetical protein
VIQADCVHNLSPSILFISKCFLFLLQIHEDLSRVKRFDAEGALEYGIIDRIIRPSRIKKEGSTGERKDRRNLGLG